MSKSTTSLGYVGAREMRAATTGTVFYKIIEGTSAPTSGEARKLLASALGCAPNGIFHRGCRILPCIITIELTGGLAR